MDSSSTEENDSQPDEQSSEEEGRLTPHSIQQTRKMLESEKSDYEKISREIEAREHAGSSHHVTDTVT